MKERKKDLKLISHGVTKIEFDYFAGSRSE